MELVLFLSSGLFLGWSLGANDAANVFGTAVGARMVRFRTAAAVCAVFVALGATVSGAGAAHTLGRLGEVNALPGAFTVALAAALTTFWMTRLRLPVSTSQSIVGAIIGWNVYTASVTDTRALARIVGTWVVCPVLAGVLAVLLFLAIRAAVARSRLHLLRLDALTRLGLLLVGAFGSYSLGANNIANVMGVFVPVQPFSDLTLAGVTVTGTQQLFLLGALAIGAGVLTYSDRVMRTVGGGLLRLSPEAALVVVLAQSLTLFLFASESLQRGLVALGLPAIPLVPVSSSQAVVGAILGIGLLKGGRGIRFNVLGGIAGGWVATPVAAGVLALLLLFVMDNVFDLQVSRTVTYRLDATVLAELERRGLPADGLAALDPLLGFSGTNAQRLKTQVKERTGWPDARAAEVVQTAQLVPLHVDPAIIASTVDRHWLTVNQLMALRDLRSRTYERAWEFHRDLAAITPDWRPRPDLPGQQPWNRELERKLEYLDQLFALNEQPEAP